MQTYYCFPEGKTKALTMSYDDGTIHDRRLVSIFNKYGIKGTFNINYGCMDRPNRVPAAEVAQLYRGHEVSTHTSHHPTIARCPMTHNTDELLEDRRGLESLVGYLVRGHAYPNGSYNEEIKALYRSLGIAYARTTKCPENAYKLPDDLMEWNPTCHHKSPDLMKHAEYLVNYKSPAFLRLLYVWGHSYEFNNDNNWNVIEEFCEYVGGRDDIWYATNIEIIDYMKVCENLQFTAACDGVYNPSAQSAWLSLNNTIIVEAKGGCFTSFQNL